MTRLIPPTNLSDELRERLTETIRNMVTDCYMRDEDGQIIREGTE